MVGADIPHTDVVAHDHDDIGPLAGRRGLRLGSCPGDRCACANRGGCGGERGAAKQDIAAVQRSTTALSLILIVLNTHDLLSFRMMHRNPTWLVGVFTASAWRAAWGERRAEFGAAKSGAPF